MKNDTKEELSCNLEEFLAMAELESADLEELINSLKLKASYCQEETAKMESACQKLQLMDQHQKIYGECAELVEKLCELQKDLNLKELTPNAVVLSHADKLRKHNRYAAKVKICLKMYIELNVILTKKIKQLKSTYEQAEKKLVEISPAPENEVKTLEKKISRYEHELTKLEKKYPWLKNSAYNLPNISKEISLLINARNEKEELVKELSCYDGLKPDLDAATAQLAEIKCEYEQMCKKMLEK